jgi:hypothetical protein
MSSAEFYGVQTANTKRYVKRNILGRSVYNAYFFLMKTTIDTESIITPLNKASFQLLTVIFPHNHHHSLCTFANDEQEPVCHARKSLRQQRQATFLQLQ